jgi:hypothetical protein
MVSGGCEGVFPYRRIESSLEDFISMGSGCDVSNELVIFHPRIKIRARKETPWQQRRQLEM